MLSGPLYDNIIVTFCVISVIKKKLGGETLLEGKHQALTDLLASTTAKIGESH